MEKTFKSFDGTEIFYVHKKNQKKHTIIFLHGLCGDWTVWKKEFEFFDKHGFSVLSLDLRGHGLSERPEDDEYYDIHNFAKDIDSIIKHEKITDYTIVGHSFGAVVACILLKELKHNPRSFVIVDSSHKYPYKKDHEFNRSPFINLILRRLARHGKLRKNYFPHLISDKGALNDFRKNHFYLYHLLYHTPLKCVWKMADTSRDYSVSKRHEIDEFLKNLQIPVLIITSEKDNTIPPKYSKELHKLIKNSKLKIIKGKHHWTPILDYEEVRRSIWMFLNKVVFKD